MERKSSRIMLFVLAAVVGIIVVAGTTLTVYTIAETSDARAQRCLDIVTERDGDRLFWFALIDTSDEPPDAEQILEFRTLLDQYKPPLRCNDRNIPVVDLPNGDTVP